MTITIKVRERERERTVLEGGDEMGTTRDCLNISRFKITKINLCWFIYWQ